MLIKKQKQEVSLQQKVDLINNASTVDNKDIEVAMKGKKLNNKDLKVTDYIHAFTVLFSKFGIADFVAFIHFYLSFRR